MRRITLALALPLVLLGTTAPAKPDRPLSAKDQQSLDKALKGLVPGKPQSCIPLRPSASLDRIGDSIFLLKVSSKLVYRTDVFGGCSSRLGSTPVIKSQNGQYCRGDIVNMVDLQVGMQQGSCALGDFVPYRAPGK